MNDIERERKLAELANLAARNPRIMEHVMAEAEEVAVRISPELAARADALIGTLADDPRLREHGRASRAGVCRLALDLGLRQLETEADTPGAGLEETARAVAPHVAVHLAELAEAPHRVREATGQAVAIVPRPGAAPRWVVVTPDGLTLGAGETPRDAADDAILNHRARST